MKNWKRILACLLIVAFLMPMLKVDMVRAEETDAYKKTVLDNYDEYIQTSQESFWLTYDERYHYEWLAEEMKNAAYPEKLGMEMSYILLEEKLKVDDCLQYLTTIMHFMDNGMKANVESQAKYDSIKKADDYLMDAGSIAAEFVGFADMVDEAKDLQNLIGLTSDTVDYLLGVDEGSESFLVGMQEYMNHKDFLTVVADHAGYPELAEAANMMMAVQDSQFAFCMEKAYEQAKNTNGYIFEATQDLLEEGFEDWIEDKKFFLRLEWMNKWDKYVATENFLAVSKVIHKYLKTAKVALDTATLAGDIFIGNEYRYLKETMVMDDLTEALHKGLAEYDPADEISADSQFEVLTKRVPLLEAFCAVRVRGEYCANMCAQANSTLLDFLVWDDEEYTEVLERDLELIQQEYQMLSEIFTVDDFVVSILWHNVEEVTEMKNGDPFCIADITYPEVLYSSAIGADQTITDYLRNEAEEIRGSYLETHFNWKGSDGRYDVEEGNPHYFTLSYGDIARMDEQVISLAGSMSTYYSGAAHGATVSTRYNFDTQTGTPLTLGNIVEDENAYKLLCDLASLYVDPEKADKENIKDTVKQQLLKHGIVDCYEDWFFTTEGLHITFPPYSIASGYLGSIDIDIPYTELMGVVKEDYLSLKPRSEKGTDICGEVTEEVDISGTSNIYFCDGPGDGKYTIALTSEGIVYDVTVHETKSVSRDYQYVYAKWPLISLSTMSASSKIIVDCGVSQDEAIPNLMITWTDGLGQKRTSLMGVDSSGELLEIMIK